MGNPILDRIDISARIRNSVDFLINAGVTIVTFDTETYDTDNLHDPVVNPGRLTINTAGKYYLFFQGLINAMTGGVIVQLRLNGATNIANSFDSATLGVAGTMNVSTVYDLVVGDFIETIGLGGPFFFLAAGTQSPVFGCFKIPYT